MRNSPTGAIRGAAWRTGRVTAFEKGTRPARLPRGHRAGARPRAPGCAALGRAGRRARGAALGPPRLRPAVDDQLTRLTADRDLVAFERGDADVDLTSVRLALRPGIDRLPTATLEQAASRFRGELLEGLDSSDCYGFHAWCIAEREAARALRAALLSTLVDRHADDPERALPFARARLDLIRWRVRRKRASFASLAPWAVCARQRSCTRASSTWCRRGSANAPAASSSALAWLSVDPGQRRLRSRPRRPLQTPPPVPAPLARLARSPFVGRERELATLTAALDGAVAGGGALLEIAGEAGMGKSRLVEELTHQARLRGARVLVGRCLEGDGSPAYLPFLDSLDAALAGESNSEARGSGRCPGRAPPAAARRQTPPVARVVGRGRDVRALPGVPGCRDAARARCRARRRRPRHRGPALDRSTLARAAPLPRRTSGRDAAVRRRHVPRRGFDPRQRDALDDLRRQGAWRVALRGLGGLTSMRSVSALGGADVPDALREQLAEATGGHPLFVQEMLKHLVEENALVAGALAVPEGVRQVIGRRLTRLSERAKRLLTLVSPIIGAFRWELVREVSKDSEDELLDALAEVLAAQLLQEGVAGFVTYEFSHRLVAQILVRLPPRAPARQAQSADRRGDRATPRRDLDPHLSALAHHFFVAAQTVGQGQGRRVCAAGRRTGDVAAGFRGSRPVLPACRRAPGRRRRHGWRNSSPPRSSPGVVSAWDEACEAFETALSRRWPSRSGTRGARVASRGAGRARHRVALGDEHAGRLHARAGGGRLWAQDPRTRGFDPRRRRNAGQCLASEVS